MTGNCGLVSVYSSIDTEQLGREVAKAMLAYTDLVGERIGFAPALYPIEIGVPQHVTTNPS